MQETIGKISHRLITNQLLRDLSQGDPMRAMGVISAEDQAILCMTLPDLCSELLAYRMAFGPLPRKQSASPMRHYLRALQLAHRALSSAQSARPLQGICDAA